VKDSSGNLHNEDRFYKANQYSLRDIQNVHQRYTEVICLSKIDVPYSGLSQGTLVPLSLSGSPPTPNLYPGPTQVPGLSATEPQYNSKAPRGLCLLSFGLLPLVL
jgi:hypothetical protein